MGRTESRGGLSRKECGDPVMIADETARAHEPESHWPDAMSWRAASVCRKHPTRWWSAGSHRETVMARGICGGCAVREPCLEFAMSRPELLGVWAATTPVERATMRRARLEPAVPVPVPVRSVVEIVAGFEVQTPPEPPQFIDLVRAEREDDNDDHDVES